MNRWELRFAAACMACRNAWYRDAQEKLYRPRASNHIDRARLSIRTASSQRRLLPTQLSAEGRSCITAKQCPCILCWTSTRRRRGLTCARMSASRASWRICTRRCGMYAMYLKQLSSYNCPSWEASLDTFAKKQANQPDGLTVSTTEVFVTDSGGDEDKMKHVARAASTPNLFLLFALTCSLHLYHCIVKRSLTSADYLCETLYSKTNARMKYVSTIAKTIHCWRDRHKAMYTEWMQAFGVVKADKQAKKMPPQKISGRWGNIEGSEARASKSCQATFCSNVQCATHLGVVSLSCFKRPAYNLY